LGDLYPRNLGLGSWRDLSVNNGILIARSLREDHVYDAGVGSKREAKFYLLPAHATSPLSKFKPVEKLYKYEPAVLDPRAVSA
jgi:hypothetical protein